MIELPALIAYYSGKLQKPPLASELDQRDINLSTLTYLNAYRTTTTMLGSLATDAIDLEAEGKLT